MIPASGNENTELKPDFDIKTIPSLTYHMDMEKNLFQSKCDGIQAVKQAVYKILSTQRYRYAIYSWKYGVELEDLYGKPLNYVISEIPRRIKDALIQDDRINDVTDFTMERGANSATGIRNVLLVKFTVISVFGAFETDKEVFY